MCKCEAKTLSAACAGWRERRSAAGANVMAARRETAPLVNAGVRSAEQHANTTASKAASDTRMARSPSPSLRKEASLGLTRGISPLQGAPDKQLQGALCSRMAGVVIEHKKGEVNELKASLRNPAIDRDPEKKRDVVKRVIAVRSTCAQPPSLRPLRVCATVRACVCVPGSAWVCIGLFLPPSACLCLGLPLPGPGLPLQEPGLCLPVSARLCLPLPASACVCLCLPISACLPCACLVPALCLRLCLHAMCLHLMCLLRLGASARLARVRVRVFVCPCLCLCLWRAQQLRFARVPTLLYRPHPPPQYMTLGIDVSKLFGEMIMVRALAPPYPHPTPPHPTPPYPRPCLPHLLSDSPPPQPHPPPTSLSLVGDWHQGPRGQKDGLPLHLQLRALQPRPRAPRDQHAPKGTYPTPFTPHPTPCGATQVCLRGGVKYALSRMMITKSERILDAVSVSLLWPLRVFQRRERERERERVRAQGSQCGLDYT